MDVVDPAFAPAKISPPRIDRPVRRPRLFERLDAGAGTRIVWVAGAPGAGKTTLIGSYLLDRGFDCLWYQLDADDVDIATFFHYFALAIRRVSVQDDPPLPPLMPELLPGLSRFTRRYAESLAERIEAPTTIVLDNYEHLPDDALLHGVVRDLAASLPSGIRIIVASRVEPPAEFARMRVNESLVVVDGQALALTREEAMTVAGSRRIDATADIAARVDRVLCETQGWFAGFNLLLSYGPLGDGRADGKARRLLYEYFATEAFRRFAAGVQVALLRCALLPAMTAADAEIVSGDATIGEALADLHRQNCFVTERGQQPPVYGFHALFRSFLLNQATTRIAADDWRASQIRAAHRLSGIGEQDAAAVLYRAAGHWSGLADLALREAPSLVLAGRHRTLDRWLADLPDAVLDEAPWLRYWRAVACLPFDAVAARGLFEVAYDGFGRTDDASGLYSAWSGIMESVFFEWRDFRVADRWIAELERLRVRHPTFPSRAVELRTYWAMGTLLHRQPQHPLLPTWAERGAALLDPSDRDLSIQLGGYLSIWFLWRGEAGEASRVLQRIAPWIAPHVSPMVRILAACAEGFYHSVRGDLTRCRLAVADGLEVATQHGLHGFDFLLAAQSARCGLIAGELDEAEAALDLMSGAMRSRSHVDGAFHELLRSHAAAQRGNRHQALEHATSSLAMAFEAGVPFLEANCRIRLAHALLGRDDETEWIGHIEAARRIGRAMRSRVVEYLCLEIEATVAFRDGSTAYGLGCLSHALALSDEMNGATWLMAGPRHTAALYARALEAGIETAHVRRQIRRHRLSPVEPAAAPDAWPWPIRVFTLGRFEVLRDDEPLRSPGKAQRKPLELLKCLCAFGGQAVNQDRVTDALWPDTDGDAADQSLRTTLHRLRRLLGHERAIRLEDRQLHLDPHTLWADCLAFDRVAHHPGMADRASLRRALDRYRGAFLDGESAAWAIAARARWRALFLQATERLGRILEADGDWTGAADCYLRAVEVEPLAEEPYRSLMKSYVRLGRRAEAMAVYQRCRTSLLTQLGIAPTPETQALQRQMAAP